jgi:hypothetical protein
MSNEVLALKRNSRWAYLSMDTNRGDDELQLNEKALAK